MISTAQQSGSRLSQREARRRMYEELILIGAEREFARVGFVETKVQGIATAADVSLATLYNTFAGKDAIYDAVHARRMTDLIAFSTKSLGSIASPSERLFLGLARQVQFFCGHPDYLRMHIRDGFSWATASGVNGINRDQAVETWRAGITMVTDGVAAAVDAGEMVPMRPELLTRLVISALQVWLTEWIESDGRADPADVATELVDYLRHAFTPTDRSAPRL